MTEVIESNHHQGVLQPKGFPPLPADWGQDWETYPSVDGKAQIFSSYLSRKNPDAGKGYRALVISHGIGEHGGRYLHFPHYLQKSLDVIVCPDHRGHGRSEGLRGYVGHFSDFEDDLVLAIRRLHERLLKRYGKAEIHVMGHSLGSLILLETLYRFPDLPIRSATVSAPLLALRMKVPIVKRLSAIAMSRIWGSVQMNTNMDVADLSHDREVQDTYIKDRLVHDKITPRLFLGMQDSMAALLRMTKPLAYPLQMLVPMDDPIVNPEVALNFYRSLKIHDKQLKTYPGFFHESFNELGKERVFEGFESWITQHSLDSTP